MTDLRADSMTGQQFVFDERTADPASTEEGERWLRTDLTSGDKIATLRVDVGTSVLDVPVFPVGTAEDSVVEAIRVRVGSQTGYIPAVPETNANFPALRLQHNGQVFGYHDEQGVFAFFDVSISSTNSPVNEGSDLNVDYSVVNTGFSVNKTQDIRLNIDSTEEDRDTNITLSPSSSTTGTLTWTTPSSSAGTYNASVLSDDDTASTSVTVEAGPAIPDSGVSRWDFENTNNDTSIAVDERDNNNGTVSGATYLSSGGPDGNGAYSFDGTNDFVSVGSPTNLVQEPFSVSALVSFDSLGSQETVFSHIESDPTEGWELTKSSSDVVQFLVADRNTTNSISGSTAVSSSTYHLFTGTYGSGGDVTVYLDDSQDGTGSGPFNAQAAGTDTGDTRIGFSTSFSANVMDGDIARVDYYSKELSSTEVDNLHATGSING